MDQRKIRTYLFYAMGEILLVVFGILIALQVNNWNEQRKVRDIEKSILSEMLLDIEMNKQDLQGDLRVQKIRLQNTKDVINHLVHRKAEYDSLSHHIRYTATSLQFTPRLVGYERLVSEGVDLIQNEELRKFIILTFSLDVEDYVLEGREYEKFENPAIDIEPYLKKYLRIDTTRTQQIYRPLDDFHLTTYDLKIGDYEALLEDDEFIVMLHKTLFSRSFKINAGNRLLEQLGELEQMILAELSTN